MTEVSPLHTPDFTIQTPDMELYQTPLNTPLENIRRNGISATVISETHQCNETTDKPNFISFLSATLKQTLLIPPKTPTRVSRKNLKT